MSDLPQAIDRLEARLTSQLQNRTTAECLGLLNQIRASLVKPRDSVVIRVVPAATLKSQLRLSKTLAARSAIVGELPPEATQSATRVIALAESRMLNLGTLKTALRDLEGSLKQHQPAVSPALRIEVWEKR